MSIEDDILKAVQERRTMDAIKLVRYESVTFFGLRESKNFIDSLAGLTEVQMKAKIAEALGLTQYTSEIDDLAKVVAQYVSGVAGAQPQDFDREIAQKIKTLIDECVDSL